MWIYIERRFVMKLKNKKNIEFICPVCKTIEKIPREIVEMLDAADQHGVDTDVPPRFDCEKCYGKWFQYSI